jgi:hypothetical protein
MKKIITIILITLSLAILVSCKEEIDEPDDTVVVDYSVLNQSFEDDMDQVLDYSWDTFQSNSYYNLITDNASDGEQSMEVTSLFGGFLSVWQVLPIADANYRDDFDDQFDDLKTFGALNETGLPEIGDQVELSVDILVDESTDITNTTPFLIYVESEDASGKKTIIAESDVEEINKNEWHTITTITAANDGVVPEDSVLLVISLQINIPEDGTVLLDNVNFGKRVDSGDIDDIPDVTYDTHGTTLDISHESFESGNPLTSSNDISFSTQSYYGDSSIALDEGESGYIELDITDQTNNYLSAGIWAKSSVELGEASIKVEAYYDGAYQLIGEDLLEKVGVWEYLKTDVSDVDLSDKDISKIKVTITNHKQGIAYFDFIQAGDYQAFNGNPEKLAMIAYQPWYDSEENGWGNWQYTDASDFDGGVNSYPSRYIDGQRDIASVYYPLIGAYDSSDREVIEYHLDLIKAMNIDVIQVNYYADLNQNMLDALEIIFELAEQKDLKVSILYEPKIHIYGWIPHNTRMDALLAVQDDIENFIDRYGDSKALLQYDGEPLVEIFGVNIIRNSEWNLILEQLSDDGYNPYLMGDNIQNSDYSSMKGMFQWNLYEDDLADTDLAGVAEHINTINNETLTWANINSGYNIPIGLVYPGFDDTKVLGWDIGEARKINITGPEFYQTAWDEMQSIGSNFDWILVATFNDWNEGTIIEPEVTWGHAMAIITQKEVAEFKGEGIVDAELLEAITQDYLDNRTNQYD